MTPSVIRPGPGSDPVSQEIQQAVDGGIFPGAVLLCAKENKIVYHQAFGLADIYEKRPMTVSSIFDLASLTKPLATALAVAQLAGQGKLSFDQTIGTLIHRFRNTTKAGITIDMLLRHTSGLPAYKQYFHGLVRLNKDRKMHLRQMLLDEPLVNVPGQVQTYSDLGFMILGWVIETVTGQSLDQYVARQIYDRLKIEHLFFIPEKFKTRIMEQCGKLIVATQNCPWRKKLLHGEVEDDNAWAVGGVDGHAGLFGDAVSICQLLIEILDAVTDKSPDHVLPPEILREMVTAKNGQEMAAGFDTPSKTNSSSGSRFSKDSFGHLGYTGTSFWVDPKKALIVIFLTNRVHPSRANEKIKQFRPILHNLVHKRFS